VRQRKVRAEPGDALGWIFLRQGVRHVIGDAQARRVPPLYYLKQFGRSAEVAVRAVFEGDRDAQPGRARDEPGQPVVEYGAGGVGRCRNKLVAAAGDDHDARGAEVRGQLYLRGELPLADLPYLRVGADQVDVGEARVDRDHPEAETAEQAGQLMPFIPAEVAGEQVRRCRGQLYRADALLAE
jgi:hypothetical protein